LNKIKHLKTTSIFLAHLIKGYIRTRVVKC